MQEELPLQISFKGLDHSDAVEQSVREHAERLRKVHRRLGRCRVTIELSDRRHTKGNLFRIHIVLFVPGQEIAVSNHSAAKHQHEDVYVAIRDVFASARRALQDHQGKQDSRIKSRDTAGDNA